MKQITKLGLFRREWPIVATGFLIGFGVAAGIAAPGAALAGPKVYSLDQCADQYVMALVPRADIAALSPRADDADSYLRSASRGLPRRRAALEPILAVHPDVVVRYWGGDTLLLAALQRRGVRVVTIGDASDFDGVGANLRQVSSGLGQPARGAQLERQMKAELAAARGAGRRQEALYLTSGGFTAGPDTLVGAMIRSAGFRNLATRASYTPVPLERVALHPPKGLVLGFFDRAALATQQWAFGRHAVVRKAAREGTVATLPSSILACPAWFAADGALHLARAARAR